MLCPLHLTPYILALIPNSLYGLTLYLAPPHQSDEHDEGSDEELSQMAINSINNNSINNNTTTNNLNTSMNHTEIPLVGGALRSRAQNAAIGVADRAAAKVRPS